MAATAISPISRLSGSTATCGCARSMRAPATSSVSSSRVRSLKADGAALFAYLGQHLGEEGAFDIPAGLDDRDPFAGETPTFFERGGQRRGGRTLHEIARIAEHRSRRLPDLVLRHGDDACCTLENDCESSLIRHPDRQTL